MENLIFFDNASTTQCCERAADFVRRFAHEEFGNPSSSHALGQKSAKAIREARQFFSKIFNTSPEQIIFTGSGSESDNLAVYGVAMDALAKRHARGNTEALPPRVICSTIEHPAVRKTVQSLSALGVDVQLAPVDKQGQIILDKFLDLLTPETVLVSIMRVNNIVGSLLPVEDLAKKAKEKIPNLIFHTDAVQAFGRVDIPMSPSSVDLVSLSAHKIEGPKGVGALIILNKTLLKNGLRPLIWGGDQEGGFRSGTQNAGLIAGFHAAAELTLSNRPAYTEHVKKLQTGFRNGLKNKKLLGKILWNSPDDAVPHIISLSVPGYPSGPLAKLLEERLCLVSTGSACSSQKMEPDPVLSGMGMSPAILTSAIRVSFSLHNSPENVDTLVDALSESLSLMERLLGGR